MTNKYDISIVGGGPGGYVAAIKASQLGMKVALFEEDRLGGVCLNWGCIPTKSLLHSAEFIEEAKHFGLNSDDLSKIALEKIVEKSRKASENLSKGVSSLMKKNKIDVYPVKAIPQIENEAFQILTNDQPIESKKLILATGCKPRTIGDTQFSDLIWSSKEAMIPKFLPKSLSIIGSGAIGIEFASIYNALGSQVTVFESQDKILPQFDKDISDEAQKIFEKKGIKFELNANISSINENKKKVTITNNDQTIESEALIISIGVLPNLDNQIIENTKINLDKSGYIETNDNYETNTKNLFAIGDIIGGPWLAHKAMHDAINCVEYISSGKNIHKPKTHHIPGCIYSLPQVATIGYTEQQLNELKIPFKKGNFPFLANGKSQTMSNTFGFVKTLFNSETGEFLGAHLIGPNVTEMISTFGIAISSESTEDEFINTVFAHPTLSESIHESVLSAFGKPLHF
ncbi:dihydrolipoyl dehydrogenase [Alphaproteobacteria bacterium]|nr:dihydrolipoyl dehydrogenase [Alphaproteobacteria bacterium]